MAAAGVAVGLSAVFALVVDLRLGGLGVAKTFDDVATAAAALAATLTSWRAARRGGHESRFWWLLAAACGAWTLAEGLWAGYDALGRSVPVPSWADVGYLGAIPLAVVAFVSHPAVRQGVRDTARVTLDAVVVAAGLLFVSWTCVLGPMWRHGALSSAGAWVAMAYPFGDLVILSCVVVVIRSTGRAADRFPLLCVVGGLVAMAVSDSVYAVLVERGHYATPNPVDAGWVVAYLAMAVGGWASGHGEAARAPASSPVASSAVLPIGVVLASLVVLTVELFRHDRLMVGDWVMALALTCLVLGRELLVLIDVRHAPGGPGPPEGTSETEATR